MHAREYYSDSVFSSVTIYSRVVSFLTSIETCYI
jgi:hypothetical protein